MMKLINVDTTKKQRKIGVFFSNELKVMRLFKSEMTLLLFDVEIFSPEAKIKVVFSMVFAKQNYSSPDII